MDGNEEKTIFPEQPKQDTELPPKLPEAWQRLLDAIRSHYGNPPEQ